MSDRKGPSGLVLRSQTNTWSDRIYVRALDTTNANIAMCNANLDTLSQNVEESKRTRDKHTHNPTQQYIIQKTFAPLLQSAVSSLNLNRSQLTHHAYLRTTHSHCNRSKGEREISSSRFRFKYFKIRSICTYIHVCTNLKEWIKISRDSVQDFERERVDEGFGDFKR